MYINLFVTFITLFILSSLLMFMHRMATIKSAEERIYEIAKRRNLLQTQLLEMFENEYKYNLIEQINNYDFSKTNSSTKNEQLTHIISIINESEFPIFHYHVETDIMSCFLVKDKHRNMNSKSVLAKSVFSKHEVMEILLNNQYEIILNRKKEILMIVYKNNSILLIQQQL